MYRTLRRLLYRGGSQYARVVCVCIVIRRCTLCATCILSIAYVITVHDIRWRNHHISVPFFSLSKRSNRILIFLLFLLLLSSLKNKKNDVSSPLPSNGRGRRGEKDVDRNKWSTAPFPSPRGPWKSKRKVRMGSREAQIVIRKGGREGRREGRGKTEERLGPRGRTTNKVRPQTARNCR